MRRIVAAVEGADADFEMAILGHRKQMRQTVTLSPNLHARGRAMYRGYRKLSTRTLVLRGRLPSGKSILHRAVQAAM